MPICLPSLPATACLPACLKPPTCLPSCPSLRPASCRPYVEDFSPGWVAGSAAALVAGAMSLVYLADTLSELKLGNGTSVLIFANIASSLPSSVGALVSQSSGMVATAR